MTFKTTRRVEFRDTDAAGIVHFSAFFPMMEAAEHEMLRSLGLKVIDRDNPDQVTWPRVSAQCDYLAPARFEDQLEISVSVAKLGNSSVQYQFDITRGEVAVARGRVTAVCCRLPEHGGLEKVTIPSPIRELFAKHS